MHILVENPTNGQSKKIQKGVQVIWENKDYSQLKVFVYLVTNQNVPIVKS